MLEEIWSRGSATVREILLNGKIRLAYTTVMTTLDRLYKKGLLHRAADGRAFRYSARCNPEELPGIIAEADLRRWIQTADAARLPHLSYFVEAISTHDARLLEELWAMVERKRLELKNLELKNKEQQ